MKKSICILVVILVLGLAPALAQNLLSAPAATPIVAVKAETLGISVTTPLVNFDVSAGGTTTAQTLGITTTWNLTPARATVDVCAVGTDLAASNVSNTDSIPVAQVQADAGSGFAAINGAAHCAQGAATLVKSHALATDGRKNVSVSDTVAIQLAGVAATLQADTYTGTITVYAYAQ